MFAINMNFMQYMKRRHLFHRKKDLKNTPEDSHSNKRKIRQAERCRVMLCRVWQVSLQPDFSSKHFILLFFSDRKRTGSFWEIISIQIMAWNFGFSHIFFFVSGCFNVWRCRLDDGKVSNCFLYAVYSATVCVSVSERLCEHCRKEVIYTWHIPLFGLLGVHKFQAWALFHLASAATKLV